MFTLPKLKILSSLVEANLLRYIAGLRFRPRHTPSCPARATSVVQGLVLGARAREAYSCDHSLRPPIGIERPGRCWWADSQVARSELIQIAFHCGTAGKWGDARGPSRTSKPNYGAFLTHTSQLLRLR